MTKAIVAALETRRNRTPMPLWLTSFVLPFIVFVFYVCFLEPRWIEIERLRIPVRKPLPPEGLLILHLSEIKFTFSD